MHTRALVLYWYCITWKKLVLFILSWNAHSRCRKNFQVLVFVHGGHGLLLQFHPLILIYNNCWTLILDQYTYWHIPLCLNSKRSVVFGTQNRSRTLLSKSWFLLAGDQSFLSLLLQFQLQIPLRVGTKLSNSWTFIIISEIG